MTRRSVPAMLFAAACALTLLGGAFLINGLYTLTKPGLGADLTLRWHELALVRAGINPYDVAASSEGLHLTSSEQGRLEKAGANADKAIASSGYPPWAFVTEMLFIYPGDFRITQFSFAALDVAALAVVLAWTFLVAKPYGTGAGIFLTASVFAMSANAATLRLGQYGIICNAFLVIMMLAEDRGWNISAGLAWALSATKPSISVLYFLIPAVRLRIAAIATAIAYLISAALLAGYIVQTSPMEMVTQMIGQSAAVSAGGVGPLNVLMDYKLPYGAVSIAFGLSGVVAAALLMTAYRHASTLTLFSIAAVLGRLAVYHRQYDNVMLVFPLVALGLRMFEKPNKWRIGSFLIFAGSLWIPLRYADYTHAVQVGLSAVWISGLCAILISSPRFESRHDLTAS